MPDQGLRPLERRLLRLSDEGIDEAELARRFARSPEHIHRILELARLPDRDGPPRRHGTLNPLERRVLRWREQGADLDEVADRFGRGTQHIAQVERMAQYKLAG